jgi:hypothetical protein
MLKIQMLGAGISLKLTCAEAGTRASARSAIAVGKKLDF